MDRELNWTEALEHLKTVKRQYVELNMPGSTWFVLYQLRKLKARYRAGERTETLYNEIMAME